MVAGGEKYGYETLNNVEIVDPFTSNEPQCKQIDNLPTPQSRMIALASQTDIRLCGGCNKEEDSSDCYRLTGTEWRETDESLQQARSLAACVQLENDNFWITGGNSTNHYGVSQSSEVFNSTTNNFETDVDLLQATAGHCMVKINRTHTYMAGSEYGPKYTAYIVNHENTPFNITELPGGMKNRWGCACGVIKQTPQYPEERDILFVAGGGHMDVAASTELYLPQQNTWIDGPPIPTVLRYGGFVNVDGATIMITGEYSAPGRPEYYGVMMIFNHESWEIEMLPGKLKNPRAYFSTVPIYDDGIC